MNIDFNDLRSRAGILVENPRLTAPQGHQEVLGPDSLEGEDTVDPDDQRSEAIFAMEKAEKLKIAKSLTGMGFDVKFGEVKIDVDLQGDIVRYEIAFHDTYNLTMAKVMEMAQAGLIAPETTLHNFERSLDFVTEYPAKDTIFQQFVSRT